MSRKTWTILFVLTLTLAVSGLVILAGADGTTLQRKERDETIRPLPTDMFQQCPTPACMAPCQFGVPAQVLCKSPDGAVSETTWTCCCCGGGGPANQFKPL